MAPPKKPLTAAQAQAAYQKLSVEQLQAQAEERIPGLAFSLYTFPQPTGGVMLSWRYNFPLSPMWEWQRTRPAEVHMGGTYRSIRECLVAILSRVDRYDTWVYEQQLQQEEALATNIARARALAGRVEQQTGKRLPELDEGDEEVPAQDLPPVKPLRVDDSESSGPSDDKRAG